MANRYGWMADTDEKAFQKLIELNREMKPGEKLAQTLQLTEMMMRISEDNVRSLYPDASQREVFLRAAARRLDRETMIRVYHWDPESGDPQ
ncbi:MAG: hypothetical protein GY953_15015 [bacterium]|nr:hypothetical protein [bacterium]